jgi:tRNA A-37 threonylcarbamoyl transferase component Bud32
MGSSSPGPQEPTGSLSEEPAGEHRPADGMTTSGWVPTKIIAGGIIWRVKPGWEWLVYGPAAPHWLHLVAEPQAEPIKRNAAREVWRVTAREHAFFAKIYRETGSARTLRAFLRGPGCELEWRAANHAQRHHIVTVEPVAYGSEGWPRLARHSILITRALSGATPLHLYWQQSVIGADPGQRRRLANAVIEAAAEALARAHQGGFHHRDLHAGNLLVVPGEENRPQVVYVDLHNVRVHRRVPDRIAIRNLAQLNQWFRQWATQTDRLRFLRSYLALRNDLARRMDSGPGMRLDYRSLLKALDKAAEDHSRRLWAKRDRTAMRDNKYFCRIRTRRGWRGHAFLRAKHVVPGSRASQLQFTRTQWREWLENPLEWIRSDRPGIIKESHTAYIGRGQLPVPDGPLDVVCKRSRPRTWLKRLAYLFGGSRNLRTWKRGYQLLNRDLPTARPLAVMERRFAGLLLDSIVMTEAISGGKDFDALLRTDLLREDARTQRRVKDQLIAELARLMKKLQARGFAHRDFKATNLLVQWDPASGQPPRLTLVDLDGLVLCRRLSRHERLRPLMRLNVSLDEARLVTRTDRLRFLKAFLTGFYFSHTDWRSLWRELAQMSDLKRVHKEKRRLWKLRRYGRE